MDKRHIAFYAESELSRDRLIELINEFAKKNHIEITMLRISKLKHEREKH